MLLYLLESKMRRYGLYRVATAVPRLYLGDASKNASQIAASIERAAEDRAALVLLPEMALTGYTLGDIFHQRRVLDMHNDALSRVLKKSEEFSIVVVLGVILFRNDRLFNCAAVLQRGSILGIVPKSYLPMRREFYEKRHFVAADEADFDTVELLGMSVPFGKDLLFCDGYDFSMGVELCEDLWSLSPPSEKLAAAGARLIVNPSASNELVGKADYRAELVRTQSARLVAAYAYCSSGIGESGTDTVFGGDAMIAEYGSLLCRNERFSFESTYESADIDMRKLGGLRLCEGNFADARSTPVRRISLEELPDPQSTKRYVDPHPFVPSDEKQKRSRCEEIVAIQSHALIRRMETAGAKKAVIGVSGGLDSTLALLAVHRAFEISGRDFSDILSVTMPGFGTTGRTYENAVALCEALCTDLREIPIDGVSRLQFEAIGHDSSSHDITYENVQARARTEILMNLANRENGIVIGTGDLSEIALGWSTYNGDHMSMYALNAGIPKTLIRYIVEYFAKDAKLSDILHDILETPVSPELLPHEEGRIVQKTEDIVGPYELHDFFLYHFLKYGAEPSKILYLAKIAFDGKYEADTIRHWLELFLKRFFTQQFKRSCMPDAPKVGTISLSPRADWRMPSDALFKEWLEDLRDDRQTPY